MQINIPGDCPTSITAALSALHDLVVQVNDYADDEDGQDYVVKTAVETDDHSVNLLAYPWLDNDRGADLRVTVVIPITHDTMINVY